MKSVAYPKGLYTTDKLYLSATQSFTDGVLTKAAFDVTDGVVGNLQWDVTNHKLVCPFAGRYSCAMNGGPLGAYTTSASNGQVHIYVNGSSVFSGRSYYGIVVNAFYRTGWLQAGDYIEFYVLTSSYTTPQILTSAYAEIIGVVG